MIKTMSAGQLYINLVPKQAASCLVLSPGDIGCQLW